MVEKDGPNPEILDGETYFVDDLEILKNSIQVLKDREVVLPLSEIPDNYSYLGNDDDNPLEWSHAMDIGLSRAAHYDIKFSSEAHASPPHKYIRPTGMLSEGRIGVYINSADYDKAWSTMALSSFEGGMRHRLLPEMMDGDIDYSYLILGNTALNRLVNESTRDLSHLDDYFSKQRERWGYVTDDEGDQSTKSKAYSVKEMITTGFIQRAFLTSRLMGEVQRDKHYVPADTEIDRAMYEVLRDKDFTPFKSEEIFGMVTGIISDVHRRYPGLKPERHSDDSLD
ncbi:MAG TPA: hypothetical protein VLF39_03080 [Candidatus Saccharimonadales bacterium]|nr:hypothetical protein [Candidatus Saccharimonadales bacterium]